MTDHLPPIGVCSWSLRPRSPGDLAEQVRSIGLSALQLHLDPIRTGAWDEGEAAGALAAAGIAVVSGMMTTEGEDYTSLESIARTGGVRPDQTWRANRQAAAENAAIAERLGIDLVTMHAGHLPEDQAGPGATSMASRLGELADVFAARGVRLGLETGQETAGTLLGYLGQIPGACVNFDPANMILYGMGDPHESLERLGPRVAQLHIKDARPATTPGTWGTETRTGDGAVDWPRFFAIAERVCPDAPMMIEREAGENRLDDVASAVHIIRAARSASA